MQPHITERIADRMDELEAKLALTEATLRDVKQLARSALVGLVGTDPQHSSEVAATLNSISTRIASAQQALRMTDDAEHKTGHERDDAELLAWAKTVGADHLEPATRLRFFAARRRATLREHGEELLRLNAAEHPSTPESA